MPARLSSPGCHLQLHVLRQAVLVSGLVLHLLQAQALVLTPLAPQQAAPLLLLLLRLWRTPPPRPSHLQQTRQEPGKPAGGRVAPQARECVLINSGDPEFGVKLRAGIHRDKVVGSFGSCGTEIWYVKQGFLAPMCHQLCG